MPDLTREARLWIDPHLLLVRKWDWKSDWEGCPFLFICDIVLMGERQGHGGLLLWCQVDSKEQRKKYLSEVTEVTVTNLFSVLTEILPFESGDELFLVVLYSAP